MMHFVQIKARHLVLAAVAVVALIAVPESLAGPPPGKGGGGGKNNASLSVEVIPATFTERDAGATGIVTRENSDTTVALSVTVTSSDGTEAKVSPSDQTEATVSATVVIPIGETFMDFDVTAVDDTETDGDVSVTISVSATDHSGASTTITVVDDEGLPQVEYFPSAVDLPTGAFGGWTNQLNNSRIAVGWYYTTTSGRLAWLYDPLNTESPNTAIDLNDLPITGVRPGWVIASAVGANNNGLVVGYIESLPDRSQRRGFVLDLLTMELIELPDSGYGWTRPAGAGVNDRGDILGVYAVVGDSVTTQGFYLVNLGLRGEAFDIEIPAIEVASTDQVSLSNPADGKPAKVSAPLSQGGVVIYSQGGGEVTYPDPNLDVDVAINDNGDIAVGKVVEVLETKGKKSRVVSRSYELFRVIDGVEESIPISSQYAFYPAAMNNANTVLISTSGGLSLYHNQDGLLPVVSLTSLAELPPIGVPRMNDWGIDGFGQIAGISSTENDVPFLMILTPEEIAP